MGGRPLLIVVNGISGSGKTTLARKLSRDLRIPCLHKDDVKELFFEKFGVGDIQWSQDLGAGVAEMLFSFTSRWIERGRDLIVENAFYHKFAAPYFADLQRKNDILLIEIYCSTDPVVRRQRILARTESGDRHAGHLDAQYAALEESEDEIAEKYAHIGVGKVFTVDTTSFNHIAYKDFLHQLQDFVAHHKEGSNDTKKT